MRNLKIYLKVNIEEWMVRKFLLIFLVMLCSPYAFSQDLKDCQIILDEKSSLLPEQSMRDYLKTGENGLVLCKELHRGQKISRLSKVWKGEKNICHFVQEMTDVSNRGGGNLIPISRESFLRSKSNYLLYATVSEGICPKRDFSRYFTIEVDLADNDVAAVMQYWNAVIASKNTQRNEIYKHKSATTESFFKDFNGRGFEIRFVYKNGVNVEHGWWERITCQNCSYYTLGLRGYRDNIYMLRIRHKDKEFHVVDIGESVI